MGMKRVMEQNTVQVSLMKDGDISKDQEEIIWIMVEIVMDGDIDNRRLFKCRL